MTTLCRHSCLRVNSGRVPPLGEGVPPGSQPGSRTGGYTGAAPGEPRSFTGQRRSAARARPAGEGRRHPLRSPRGNPETFRPSGKLLCPRRYGRAAARAAIELLAFASQRRPRLPSAEGARKVCPPRQERFRRVSHAHATLLHVGLR